MMFCAASTFPTQMPPLLGSQGSMMHWMSSGQALGVEEAQPARVWENLECMNKYYPSRVKIIQDDIGQIRYDFKDDSLTNVDIIFKMDESLCELCEYSASDARLTYRLRQLIDGYNNNRNYTTTQAQKDREAWLDQYQITYNSKLKHPNKKEEDEKEEFLFDLLHPEEIYNKPKKKDYEVVKEPYGKDNVFLKAYQDAFVFNFQNNQVEFRLTSEEEFQKHTEMKVTQDYIKSFNEQFGHILMQQSPEYWQTMLYDILVSLADKKKTEAELQAELYQFIPDDKGIKYLITFRKEICEYLRVSNFFGKEVKDGDIYVGMDKNPVSRKKPMKEKPSQLLLGEELAEVDFTTMKEHELVLKIPTLKKNDYLEYAIFKIEPMPKVEHEVKLIEIKEAIPKEFRDCFESQKLNTIQTLVFESAYSSNENMLVCAPTGAGKTNIATLTILNIIKKFKGEFKVVYISPMKALANELVQKFTKKFHNFKTREMTGDIQLSQKQLATTHIIVTTPEKLDVVTRKNTNLLEELKLVILDEVHLLNDERGWVLESLVSRIFRSTERTQKNIRLVGLSATLPNYLDVSNFLKVDPNSGLYHFDSSFRPVPLALNFVGCKEPAQRRRRIQDVYNEKCYEIAMSNLKQNKQVLVFVHSRKETVTFCEYIAERAKLFEEQYLLQPIERIIHKYKVQDRKLQKAASSGLGFHHAGMIRSDRNEVEKMFNNGEVKILVATATLAWGVNLPAYAVIIKGTDIYDPNISERRDLSILDVQQMFGRAGRPQFDTKGEATLMTSFKKVSKYMGALTNTAPIESQFFQKIKEALNAEICSGTVTNEHEAFEWIGYTFFAIRAQKNPTTYGIRSSNSSVEQEMFYEEFLRKTVVDVIEQLDRIKLLRYDRKNLSVSSTDLGRITSHFYIKCDTMEHFCKALHITISNETGNKKKYDYKTDMQLLNILAESKEFENIRVRMEEFEELKGMMKYWLLEEKPNFTLEKSKGMPQNSSNYDEQPIIETPQKVLLLLQGYLLSLSYDNYSLTNDTQYIVQNGIRLLRCLFDLCGRKAQAQNVQIILKWCKFLENRMYQNDSPMIQFTKGSYSGYNSMKQNKKEGFLSQDNYNRFVDSKLTVDRALELDTIELAAVLGTTHHRSSIQTVIKEYCGYLPRLDIQYTIKPIAQTILKVDLDVTPLWNYTPKWHLKSEIFWVFFDDEEEILHSQSFAIDEQFMRTQTPFHLSFFIPFRDSTKKVYRLIVRSDRWIMDNEYDDGILINLSDLGIDMDTQPFTPLLNLEPLPRTALKNQLFESLYSRFNFFNPIQTQLFFSLYHTDRNVLIGAPTGSGKTIMSELAILKMFSTSPDSSCVYIAPLKSLARERLIDWVPRFAKLKKSVVQLTGDFTPDIESLNKAHIIVTTPEKWDGITRKKDLQYIHKVKLVIFDEIHLLGQDRGAVIEVIVSRMNRLARETKIRMIGLSTAMANGADVAEWFGTGQHGFFNFKPSVRPVPIDIHFEGFTEKNYCPRMATMNKPAYNHIKKFSEGKPVLVFVSSRRQTRLTALDLIALSSHETKGSNPYVKCSHEELLNCIDSVGDEYLKQTLSFGIGMHHAGLTSHDRSICEEMFVNNKIQILIATSTLAWGVNFPARLVIIKGTEFFDPKSHRYVDFPATDLLQMIGRAGRPQFDTKGVAVVYCEQSKKNFYRRYLNDPFPIESSLLEQIDDHVNAEVARGEITSKQGCIDWFTWSYAFRRILKNPNYYGLQDNKNNTIKDFLIKFVDDILERLRISGCVEVVDNEENTIMPTELGFIASNFYLKHQTAKHFNTQLKDTMDFKELLHLISHAEEFLETPLRHNEDNFNRELSDVSPYPIKDYASPQGKTLLLLQMHMFELPPPIRDYLTDAKLIIDASTRVVMGLIEIAMLKKYARTIRTLIYIQQAISQGFGCNIPWFSYTHFQELTKRYRGGLAYLVENLGHHEFKKEFSTFLKKNIEQFDSRKQKDILECLESLPRVRMSARLVAFDSQNMKEMPECDVEEGTLEAIVKVQIVKENRTSGRVQMQKGTKVKDVSWWLVITDTLENLLSIKKVFLKHRVTISSQIDLPSDFSQSKQINVYLMTDCYLGLDQMTTIDLLRGR